jgi:heptosyltransferase II
MSAKILIIGPSWVGDMIMAQVLLLTIKQQKPDAIIDVIAPKWSSMIIYRMPEVRTVITLSLAHGEFGLRKRYDFGVRLRAEGYTHAYILTNSWKSALIPFFACIPIRTGWCGEARFGLLTDLRFLNKNKYPKMVERYVALGYPKHTELPTILPTPKLSVDKDNLQAVITKLKLLEFFINKKKIIALCPGAAFGSAKRWPEEYFSGLARQKIAEGCLVWIFGSEQDKPVIQTIIQQLDTSADNYFDFSGKINLLETVDLFSVVDTVVANDSGLMHLAASLDKPLVAIYGPTSDAFTPPLGTKSKIMRKPLSCSPCFKRECPLQHHRCMRDITPKEVLYELELLESS